MSTKKHILIISYLFEPDNTVGAKRASYWAKNITQLASHIKCDVISTIENKAISDIENYYHIPNPKKPKGLIKDEGVTWKKEIKKWIAVNKKKYDVVIMSGSPFMYFSIAKEFKKRGAKIILDYRDPFANNPRFNNSFIKIKIKKFYENKFNRLADKILSVNSFCLSLLSTYKKQRNKFTVIPNGYENVEIPQYSILSQEKINFIYTGTFFEDRDPKNFLKVILKNDDIKFHHIGKPTTLNGAFKINAYGLKTYPEMLEGIDEADIGIIFSSGKAFESTTKIYDYIYRKKPIWVISNTKITNGGIWEELKDYPAVIWSINTEENIANDLPKALKMVNAKIDFDTAPYSRKEGLNKLIKLIEELY